MSRLDDLWGGTLTGVDLDVAGHSVRLSIQLVDEGVTSKHELLFEGVTECRFYDEQSAGWDLAEVTEIEASTDLDGSVLTNIVLWVESAGFSIRSQKVSLDRQEVPVG